MLKVEIKKTEGSLEAFICATDSEQLLSYFDSLFYEKEARDRVIAWIKQECSGHITILKNLYVEPAFRGQKVGKALLEEFLAQKQGSVILVCDLLESQNEGFSLESWYRRRGFKDTGFSCLSGPILVL